MEEIVPTHKQAKGRPGKYPDRTIVLLYVLFVLMRCSSIVEMYKMIEGKKRLLKVIGELPSRQTISYRVRRLTKCVNVTANRKEQEKESGNRNGEDKSRF